MHCDRYHWPPPHHLVIFDSRIVFTCIWPLTCWCSGWKPASLESSGAGEEGCQTRSFIRQLSCGVHVHLENQTQPRSSLEVTGFCSFFLSATQTSIQIKWKDIFMSVEFSFSFFLTREQNRASQKPAIEQNEWGNKEWKWIKTQKWIRSELQQHPAKTREEKDQALRHETESPWWWKTKI